MNLKIPLLSRYASFFSNSSWLFANYVLKLVGGYFISIWLARYLGPESYGAFNYAIANLTIFGGIAAVGMTGVFVKTLLKDPAKEAGIMGTAFVLRMIGSFLSYICLAGIIMINSWGSFDEKYLLSAIVGINVLLSPTYVIDLYFESKMQTKRTVYARSVAYVLRSVLMVIFILAEIQFLWLGVIIVLEEILGSYRAYRNYKIYAGSTFRNWHFDRGIAHKLLRESWPLIISTVGAVLYLKLDQIMLIEMTGEAEGGYYSAAVKLSEIFYFVPTVLMTSLFPRMVSRKKISEAIYYAYIKKVMALFAVISFCIIIPVSVFADDAISYTFGKTYLAAVPVVRIHIYGLYFIFLAQVLSKWLIIEELTRYSLVRSLTGLIINVILNLILIPRMGGEGAAWATVGALAGAVVVFAGFDRHTRPFLKALLASFYTPIIFFRKHVK